MRRMPPRRPSGRAVRPAAVGETISVGPGFAATGMSAEGPDGPLRRPVLVQSGHQIDAGGPLLPRASSRVARNEWAVLCRAKGAAAGGLDSLRLDLRSGVAIASAFQTLAFR